MAAPPSASKPGDFPPGGDKPGMIHHPPPPRQWIPDQRDAFIAWLRGEFAAANAIIDALCQHLHLTGAPGEYDFVLGAIQQRRFTWSGVLHMQQYFSVNDVLIALQQALMMRKQLPQHQMPNGGGGGGKMPIPGSSPSPQQPPKTFTGPNGGPRRDFYGNPRRQERPKQRNVLPGAGVPPPGDRGPGSKLPDSLHEDVEVLEDENFNSASGSQLSSPASSRAQQEDDNVPSNKSNDNGQEHVGINENPMREDSLMEEPGRMKGSEAATVEVVETGRKVNVVEGELYHHVFGGVPLPQMVTEVLDTSSTTGVDQSCMRGRVHAIPDNQKERPDKKPPSSVPDYVHSVVGYLSRVGVLSGSHRPDCFIMNVVEEGKSFTMEEHTLLMQPQYIVALLSDCSVALRKRSDKTDSGGSSLLLPAGSMLKVGTSMSPSGYVVNASPMKRILILLGVDQQPEKKPSTKPTTSKQAPNSGSSKSQGGSSSSYQAWQARPGTGVYIPSSNRSKCDIAMSYRACVQDVR